MVTLKYFDNFSESINELSTEDYDEKNPEPKVFNFDNSNQSLSFEFYDEKNPYLLRVFPELEMICLSFPDGSFQWCSFSALKKSKEPFKKYVNGILFEWILRVILHVEYSLYTGVKDWTTLDTSMFGQQE